MAVDVVTHFGANTKKFDQQVKDSAQKAKKQLDAVSKGASVAGGSVGALGGKFKSLASGGMVSVLSAGVGLIAAGLLKCKDLADAMFKDAVTDAKNLAEDIKSVNAINAKKGAFRSSGLDYLREIQGKELTNSERVKAEDYIARMKLSGVSVSSGRLTGFTPEIEMEIEQKLIREKINALKSEIKQSKNIIAANNELLEKTDTKYNWLTDAGGTGATIRSVSAENSKLVNTIMDLSNQIKELEHTYLTAGERADARQQDIADAEAKKLQEAAEKAAEKAAEEARKKQEEYEKETRAGQIKYYEKEKNGLRLDQMNGSALYTNSLTSRGGFAGGARLSDTTRYQSQIVSETARISARLVALEKKIEDLKKI